MKICITLDDVLRAKTVQFGKIYQKNINPDIDLESLDFSTNDYKSIFGFKSDKEYNDFLYNDEAFAIFGEANMVSKMLDKYLNLWHIHLNDDEDELGEHIDVMLSNTNEFNQSIGFSYFFLSKAATRIREIFFPSNHEDIWEKCDVLITADPQLLEEHKEGVKLIKIKTSYNEKYDADYTYDSLLDFINDKDIIRKLVKGE